MTEREGRVPYVEVLVDAADATYEDVTATVNGVLGGILEDVLVVLTGPWSSLSDGRRDLFADPLLDLRLVREEYAADVRVRQVEAADPAPGEAPFRFSCPAGWVPSRDGLHRLTEEAEAAGLGVFDLTLSGAASARLTRTASSGGTRRDSGAAWGMLPAADVPPPGPPRDWRAAAAQAAVRLERAQDEVRRLREELAELPARGPRTRRFLRS